MSNVARYENYVVVLADAHISQLREGSFINIPYSFIVRDVTSLPTSMFQEHEQKYGHLTDQEAEDENFPFKYILRDEDIEPYMSRWVLDRWENATVTDEHPSGHQQSRSRPISRMGKRTRQEIIEQRSKTNEQRHSTMEDEESEDQDYAGYGDDFSLPDNEFVIAPEEAVEVLHSLRAFTAAEMMP